MTLCSSVCLYHNLALGFVQGIASEYNWMSNSALGPKLCSVIEMICLLWGKALLCHQYVSSSINTLIRLASLIQKHPLDLLLYSDRISIDAACFAAKPLMNNPPQKREKKKKLCEKTTLPTTTKKKCYFVRRDCNHSDGILFSSETCSHSVKFFLMQGFLFCGSCDIM